MVSLRYGHSNGGPINNGLLFESFNGKIRNDSPRALFDAVRKADVQIPLYWSVKDRTVEVPPGGITIVEGTAVWHAAMATTKVLVNNNNFPYYVNKRHGQYYLQTWHGTPIKKLHADMPRRKVSLTYRRLMSGEANQWDLLLDTSRKNARQRCCVPVWRIKALFKLWSILVTRDWRGL